MKAKPERSSQAARERRARKRLRALMDLVDSMKNSVMALRTELNKYYYWNLALDQGHEPEHGETDQEMSVVKQGDNKPF